MRSLAILVLTDLVVLIVAAATGMVVAWVLQILLDLGVVAFFMHLRRMAVQAAAARRRAARQRQQRRALEEALAEPAWEEGVTVRRAAAAAEPVFVGAAAAAAAAPVAVDDVFDQTALSDDALLAPASASVAASDGFFDQEVDLGIAVEDAPSFVEAGVQRASRVVIESGAMPEAPPAEAVGGSPWEPVPVPKPTYAMKPAAPPRAPRRRASEPILPPVEPAAELDNEDDLEAILDRRWAVND